MAWMPAYIAVSNLLIMISMNKSYTCIRTLLSQISIWCCRFESGNLERAVKITEAYYELHIRSAKIADFFSP
jgi:hypothetical protein